MMMRAFAVGSLLMLAVTNASAGLISDLQDACKAAARPDHFAADYRWCMGYLISKAPPGSLDVDSDKPAAAPLSAPPKDPNFCGPGFENLPGSGCRHLGSPR